VRSCLKNTYGFPWSHQHLHDLSPHQRLAPFRADCPGDRADRDGCPQQRRLEKVVMRLAICKRGGIPLIDDTSDGSAGSGLITNKFLSADGAVADVFTGSAKLSRPGTLR